MRVMVLVKATAWVKRCPNAVLGPSEIEIRPLYEFGNPSI